MPTRRCCDSSQTFDNRARRIVGSRWQLENSQLAFGFKHKISKSTASVDSNTGAHASGVLHAGGVRTASRTLFLCFHRLGRKMYLALKGRRAARQLLAQVGAEYRLHREFHAGIPIQKFLDFFF